MQTYLLKYLLMKGPLPLIHLPIVHPWKMDSADGRDEVCCPPENACYFQAH